MKKILITGGSGFIGSNLINYLIKKNYKIYNLDKLSKVSTPEKFKTLRNKKNYKFYKVNLLNKKKVEKIFYQIKPDLIINFAAESHVDRSIDDPSFFLKNNILVSINLFEIFKNFSKSYKKSIFFHISTDEVFGSILKGSSAENARYNPSSPYASSKASADLIAISFIKTYKLPIKILNLCNNFGPYQFLEKYIPTVIFNLINNNKAPIYGNGKNIREWIFVQDTCEAIYKILKIHKKYERLNVGSSFRLNNIQLASIIFNILKEKKLTSLNKKNFIEFIKDRPGHDTRYSINSNLFYKKTKFKIKYEIKTGIKKTIEWYLTNKKWVNFQKNRHSNKRIGLNDK
jgi:dTDP-glucose 4,6-dehydratase